jgi:hypothetical protein
MVPLIQPQVRLTNENAETMIRLVSLSPDESDKAEPTRETKFVVRVTPKPKAGRHPGQ